MLAPRGEANLQKILKTLRSRFDHLTANGKRRFEVSGFHVSRLLRFADGSTEELWENQIGIKTRRLLPEGEMSIFNVFVRFYCLMKVEH